MEELKGMHHSNLCFEFISKKGAQGRYEYVGKHLEGTSKKQSSNFTAIQLKKDIAYSLQRFRS